MKNPYHKFAFVTWSGGIDSTLVIAQALANGYQVQPVSIIFGGTLVRNREQLARTELEILFRGHFPGLYRPTMLVDGNFLDAFEVAGVEQMNVPRRNRLILDYMMSNFVLPSNAYYLGMGTYIGSDTGVVDHVPAEDADTRFLQAYLLQEYGVEFRLLTCDTWGEARTKGDRVAQLVDILGPEGVLATSNCGANANVACGNCYNCAERSVAIEEVLGKGFDTTHYSKDPHDWPYYDLYVRQHAGEVVKKVSWEMAL